MVKEFIHLCETYLFTFRYIKKSEIKYVIIFFSALLVYFSFIFFNIIT